MNAEILTTLQRRTIYGVSIGSALESLTLLTLYGWLIGTVSQQLDDMDTTSPRGAVLNSTRNLAATMVAVYILRLFIALALFKKTYISLMTFYIATQAGILVNLTAGFIGTFSLQTYGIGWTTLCVIGIHIIYITTIHGVIKAMREGFLNKLQRSTSSRHVLKPTVSQSTLRPEQNTDCPPYNADANVVDSCAPPSYLEAPPSYVAEFGSRPRDENKEICNKC